MLCTQTTSPKLFEILKTLMGMELLSGFRLVGGTALSLLRGHRISDDIDLFTYQEYGTVDFAAIENQLRSSFSYTVNTEEDFPELEKLNKTGLHLFVGADEATAIKLDILNWSDPFYFETLVIDDIRFATETEIATMKLDAISRGGRKKDFWDLSDLLESYALQDLLQLYRKKYPYYNIDEVKKGLTDFSLADNMPDPVCLKNNRWDMVKKKIIEEAGKIN